VYQRYRWLGDFRFINIQLRFYRFHFTSQSVRTKSYVTECMDARTPLSLYELPFHCTYSSNSVQIRFYAKTKLAEKARFSFGFAVLLHLEFGAQKKDGFFQDGFLRNLSYVPSVHTQTDLAPRRFRTPTVTKVHDRSYVVYDELGLVRRNFRRTAMIGVICPDEIQFEIKHMIEIPGRRKFYRWIDLKSSDLALMIQQILC
jgi:hypothetical protein